MESVATTYTSMIGVIGHYALSTQHSTHYAAQGYYAPVLKAGHLVSCLCVCVCVFGLSICGGVGSGFFLRYTHVHEAKTNTLFNGSETTLPAFATTYNTFEGRQIPDIMIRERTII